MVLHLVDKDGVCPGRIDAVVRKYKAIFFDADDTLFDYPAAERAALLACLGEFAIADRA